MVDWDSSLVDYLSEDFIRGHDDGRARREPAPPARDDPTRYASYMEGWLMGDAMQG